VEDVQDSEEIVVKPLPEYLKSTQCYAGATIMGDGKVAMILDPNGVAIMAELKFDDIEKEISSEKKQPEEEKHKLLNNLLLFSIGGPENFAIDLSAVSRIEKRKIEEIELVGNKEFLKYENSTLRLFRIENYIPVQPSMESPDTIFVIVPKNVQYPLGFVTASVEDTIETELNVDTTSVKGNGIRGSAIINKKMTVIIDVPELIQTLENEINM
jgi:two-component system chemotaxis sensor kinase CheA